MDSTADVLFYSVYLVGLFCAKNHPCQISKSKAFPNPLTILGHVLPVLLIFIHTSLLLRERGSFISVFMIAARISFSRCIYSSRFLSSSFLPSFLILSKLPCVRTMVRSRLSQNKKRKGEYSRREI